MSPPVPHAIHPPYERRRDFDRSIDQLTRQVEYLSNQHAAISLTLSARDVRITAIETSLAENTEMTRDIRDAIVAGKVFTRVMKWAGAIAMAGAALYTAIYMAMHDGASPGNGGIGPTP